MDVQAVLSTVAVFLITAGSDQIILKPTGATLNETRIPSLPTQAPGNHIKCNCPQLDLTVGDGAVLAQSPMASHLQLGLLKVKWTRACEGGVELHLYQQTSLSPVCNSSDISCFLKTVCQERRGCKGPPHWYKGGTTKSGYHIQDNRMEETGGCDTLRVQCSVAAEGAEADLQGQLRAYKVLTALLCCGLLLLLMIRFTKPTVKALQKRLSDRRQNRWIGPTQSHSVSYHREQNAVKTDREKRLSYPALERLTVVDSREPSSNRNSDCNY